MLHLLQAFYATPWALDPVMYAAMESVIERWATGVRLTQPEIAAAVGNAPQAAAQRREAAARAGGGTVAVVPVYGVLTHRAHQADNVSTPLTSTERLASQIRTAVADPQVSAVILDVDSPGGSVHGVQELGDVIYGLRGQKPIVAVANATAASGAYWVASQADEIVITPSGGVGSVGVITKRVNAAEAYKAKGMEVEYITAGKYKAEGADTGPMTDEERAHVQGMANAYYGAFTKAIARGRGQPIDAVRGEAFGEGRMRLARDAVAAGMADRVDTLEATISRYAGRRNGATAPAVRSLSASTAAARVAVLQASAPLLA